MSNKVIVKEVRRIKSDVGPLVETVYKNFAHLADTEQLDHNRQEIKRLLSNREMMSLFVYDSKGQIISYLIGEFKNLNDGRYVYYISYLYVAPKYRAKKLGSQLMTNLINKCKYIGIKYIILTCDTNDKKIHEFYKKLGFMPDPLLKNFKRHEVLTLYL